MIRRSQCMIPMAGLLSCLPGGCAHVRTQPDIAKAAIAFLQPGKVSEEDLLLHFGAPTGRFDGERVFTWRLGRTYTGEAGPAARAVMHTGAADNDNDAWQGTLYDLVVVFDDHRLLKRFSLISVHPE